MKEVYTIEYTIKKIASLSGVSTRTLRYYDEIKLLKPARINSSGYRIYGKKEVDRLQQILFYRTLEIPLNEISILLDQPDYDPTVALKKQYRLLLEKKRQLEQLLVTIEKTINYQAGNYPMNDQEKFIGLKKRQLYENEKKYGNEIRAKYGNDKLLSQHKHWFDLSIEAFQAQEAVENELIEALCLLLKTKDSSSEQAKKEIFDKHKKWLHYVSPSYSSSFHRALGQLYCNDTRFTSYYDQRAGKGATRLLNHIIQKYSQ